MFALVALTITGCTVTLRTDPSPQIRQICLLGAFEGILASDFEYGLGLEINGSVHGVIWPTGYSARREPDGIVLLDRSSHIIAREGDTVQMAGTLDEEGVGHPCDPPELEVVRTRS